MNSMSKGYYDPCKKHENFEREHCEHKHCECEHCRRENFEHEHCEHKHCEREHCENEKHCPTIIKCGAPSSTTISKDTKPGTTFIVSSLTLDNSCLCNPITKLEFASNIFTAADLKGTVNFQVFKICKCQLTPVPVGPAWTFELAEKLSAQTFSFFVCDCDSCFNECCTYTVVATVNSMSSSPAPGGTTGTLNVNTATLGAISTCSTCSRNNCC